MSVYVARTSCGGMDYCGGGGGIVEQSGNGPDRARGPRVTTTRARERPGACLGLARRGLGVRAGGVAGVLGGHHRERRDGEVADGHVARGQSGEAVYYSFRSAPPSAPRSVGPKPSRPPTRERNARRKRQREPGRSREPSIEGSLLPPAPLARPLASLAVASPPRVHRRPRPHPRARHSRVPVRERPAPRPRAAPRSHRAAPPAVVAPDPRVVASERRPASVPPRSRSTGRLTHITTAPPSRAARRHARRDQTRGAPGHVRRPRRLLDGDVHGDPPRVPQPHHQGACAKDRSPRRFAIAPSATALLPPGGLLRPFPAPNPDPPPIPPPFAQQQHPDKGGDAATFALIQKAYDLLSDDAKRARATTPTARSRNPWRRNCSTPSAAARSETEAPRRRRKRPTSRTPSSRPSSARSRTPRASRRGCEPG